MNSKINTHRADLRQGDLFAGKNLDRADYARVREYDDEHEHEHEMALWNG